jgi:hypothetical protein
LLVIASANNEYKPMTSLVKVFDPQLSTAYTENELNAMLPTGFDKTDELRAKTGHVPYEMKLFLENPAGYEASRNRDVELQFQQRLRELSDEPNGKDLLQRLRSAVMFLSEGVRITADDESRLLLDCRFMFVENDSADANLKVVRALTPLVRRKICGAYPREDIREAVKQLLNARETDGGTKGRLVERLIISDWRESQSACVSADGPAITIDHTHRWSGNTIVEPGADLLHNRNVLLWPESSNYPDVDCLVWEWKTKTLYAVQITIGDKHDYSFNEKSADWLKAVRKTTGVGKAAKCSFVWIGRFEQLKNAHASSLPHSFVPLSKFHQLDGCEIQQTPK